MINVIIFTIYSKEEVLNHVKKQANETFNILVYNSDDDINKIFREHKPDAIVTYCNECHEFPKLNVAPYFIRSRWIHLRKLEDITIDKINFCFRSRLHDEETKDFPLISIFTTSYKSKHRILRPFISLRNQTYQDWEWVIVDDSDDNGDNWKMLEELSKKDFRIRIYKPGNHDGYIGSVKRDAAMLCRGDILIELDHDDDILPETLYELMIGFKNNPEIGMLCTDFTEVFEDTLENWQYGELFGFGYGSYYKQLYQGRWVNAYRSNPVNPKTMRHIIGVPNHIRAWRADLYRELGGHNYRYNVADDYELIVRTFLKSKIGMITKMLYIQYRNAGGNNFTFIRNRLIQDLTHNVFIHYNDDIAKRFDELGIDDHIYRDGFGNAQNSWLNHKMESYVHKIVNVDDEIISVVVELEKLDDSLIDIITSMTKQTYAKWELYIIAGKLNGFDQIMEGFKDYRIKWWNIFDKFDRHVLRNYACKMLVVTKYVTYLEGKIETDHLEKLMENIKEKNLYFDGKHLIHDIKLFKNDFWEKDMTFEKFIEKNKEFEK